MSRTAIALLLLAATIVAAQTAPTSQAKEPPQTARQALIEAFFGESPNHLEKHLPEITRKAFRQLDSGSGNRNFLTEMSMIGMQAKAGGVNFQTMDTGPVLLSVNEPRMRQRFEIIVERDDLVGDENQIELSFHVVKGGEEEHWPVVPRLTFSMKTEADIWRIYDISLTVRAPIGDPDFLKTLVKTLTEQQQKINEAMAAASLRTIAAAEATYKANGTSGAYVCSLSKLTDESGKAKQGDYAAYAMIDSELATGKKSGYVFVLTGCDALHFKAVAEPSTPAAGRRAFCVDESNTLKFSSDGKATTCLSRGETLGEQPYGTDSATGLGDVIP